MTWTELAPFIALLGIAFAFWRYLDRKFERIDTQFIAIVHDIGEMKGEVGEIKGRLDAIKSPS